MKVLSVIHGERGEPGTFGDEVAARGHELEEWSFSWGRPAPRPLEDYGAVLVFGGAMHADQDEQHPWLREEAQFLRNVLELGQPVLGVCLGAQLLAQAAGAPVMRAAEPEIGWVEVSLMAEAGRDPVFARLPGRFQAFQWHYYTYGLPTAAAELARSRVCTQALRLADRVWGIQFHAEVTSEQISRWLEHKESEAEISVEEIAAETRERIAAWNRLGRDLCGGFLEVAERLAA